MQILATNVVMVVIAVFIIIIWILSGARHPHKLQKVPQTLAYPDAISL